MIIFHPKKKSKTTSVVNKHKYPRDLNILDQSLVVFLNLTIKTIALYNATFDTIGTGTRFKVVSTLLIVVPIRSRIYSEKNLCKICLILTCLMHGRLFIYFLVHIQNVLLYLFRTYFDNFEEHGFCNL